MDSPSGLALAASSSLLSKRTLGAALAGAWQVCQHQCLVGGFGHSLVPKDDGNIMMELGHC